MATVSDLQQLYIGYFGRAADQAGLNFWLGAINNDGLSLANVHAAFVNSEEYNAQYEGLSVSAKVAAVYENVLGRAADAEGQAFWTNAIETGAITEDQLIEGLLSGLSPKDALAISNKIVVANYYTSAKGDSYAEADKAESSQILAGVDSTTKSVSDALELVGDAADNASNADLVAALAALEAAEEAQLAYAKSVLKDEEGTVADAQTKVAGDLTAAQNGLTANGVAFNAADSTALTTLKIKEAQDAAAKAVTDARAELATTAGLPALVTKFNTQLEAFTKAAEAKAAAETEQAAELAKFNVVKGGTAATIAADGVVAGIIVKNASGELVLSADYSGNSQATTAAQKAAADALLVDIKTFQAASKADAAANTALDATGAQIDAAGADTYDAATNALTGGPAAALQGAVKAQADLAEAVTAYNDAKAASAEWEGVSNDVTEARDVFTDLGYSLVEVESGAAAGSANKDVFVFEASEGAATASVGLTDGDVLFVGANYKLGAVEEVNGDQVLKGDNSAFELFFVQATANTVEIHVENSVFGSSAATPEVTTIALTGVTSVDQLSFDAKTGMVTFADVA